MLDQGGRLRHHCRGHCHWQCHYCGVDYVQELLQEIAGPAPAHPGCSPRKLQRPGSGESEWIVMNLQGTHRLKASREQVWEALNDPDVLRRCTPGCQQMRLAADGSYDVLMEVGIAAFKGRYTGKMQIKDRIPGSQYKLAVTGKGSAGFLSAEGLIQLKELGEETLIEYSGQAHVGGLIAGVGQRLMSVAAKQIVGQFFQCFEKAVLQPGGGSGRGAGQGEDVSERPGDSNLS